MTLPRLLLLASLLAACTGTPGPSNPSNPPPSSTGTAPPSGTGPKPADPPAAPVDFPDIEAAIKAGDGAKAKKLAEEALAKNPKNAKAHYYAGVGAELSKDVEGAEKHYREALALVPTFNDAAVNLSTLLLDSKRAPDAVALLKPFAEKADDPLVLNNYATALETTGAHDQAAAVFAKLVQKAPTPENRLGYAGTLIAAGKKDEAAKTLREGVAAAGDNRDLYAAFGRALAQAGAFDDAIKALDKALQLKPSHDLFTYRALFKRSAKNPEGARSDLKAAIKENPKFAPAYRYLGEVFEELKKPADAKKAYEKAAELDPDGGHGKKAKERLEALKKK